MRLGFLETVVILCVTVILFGPWIVAKVRRSIAGGIEGYKEAKRALDDSADADKDEA
ncbi:MAG: twin-arginine translocase TatA/TatE family subunit [Limnochordia bacterium]